MPGTPQTTDTPRYVTLRDYLRVLREHRLLIVLVTLVFAGAAVALSVTREPTYRAEAALAFVDVSADTTLLGTDAFPLQTPETLAAISAETVTRRPIAERVARELDAGATPAELQAAVTARPEARTNLVIVQAEWDDGAFAARLADEFARQARLEAVRRARERFADAARSLRRQFRALRGTTDDVLTRAAYADRVNRLESLSRFVTPAQVARTAAVPGTPVSPKPVRDGILGGLIGLTLGILAAFVRDSLDRRLRGSREIQEHLDLPLLGAVRDDAMGRAGPVANGRGRMDDADLEAFRILRANLEFLDVDNPVRTVVVTSALPEEGKSTVAASLAFASAAAGKRTLLVECDLRRPSLAGRLGLAPAPGLADYLAGQATPQEVIQTVSTEPSADVNGNGAEAGATEAERLVCIVAGGPAPRPAELLGSRRFREFLAKVSEVYDAVVLDTSPLLSVVDTLELVPQVDGVIVCVRAARTTRDQARAAKAAIEHLPDRPTGLVVTGVRAGDEADYGYYYAPAQRS